MAGFLKIAIKAEHYGQSIVNTFGYRSTDWPWVGVGNPFADVLKVLDDFWTNCGAEWLATFNQNYRVLEVQGVAMTDAFVIATPQPVIKTINTAGGMVSGAELETTGSSVCATLGFILSNQVQILGTKHSLRNRGYISIGPVPEVYTDSYGHISLNYLANVEAIAQKVVMPLVDIPLTATFTPVRFHGVRVKDLLGTGHHWDYLTYSDVVGYRLPRRASWRRSRMPEA